MRLPIRVERTRMGNNAGIQIPTIDDSDIPWVCGLLGLPATAFSGADGTDPRLPILRAMETLDIEACPGSGKTTLLVAKLAILARNWAENRRGLCVLSHTNVARREIETRLGNTAAGQRLLGYPHFIGTIHGFVNEFMALPWLRSLGYPIEMIDDEVCLRRRWRKLGGATRLALEGNHHTEQLLRFKDTEFGLGEVRWGQGRLGQDTPTYRAMRGACETSAREGYFCHDEMFVWAHDMIDMMPGITECLRARFPFMFIDEVQDNSELQSKLLHRVFMDGDSPATRQRLGDANQAIYQPAGQSEGAATDPFPVAEIRTDVPNSFRFDQSIADLADPLGVEPQGLQGLRQQGADGTSRTAGKHAVFLFDDARAGFVLESYATYLTDVFSDDELREGSFTAIGAVHRPKGDDNVPRSVEHYWTAYDHEISLAEPQPGRFVQYVMAGHRFAQRSGESHAFVEKVADGMLRLVRLASPERKLSRRKRRHRYVLELLEEQDEARYVYLDLVRTLCVDRVPLTKDGWENEWRAKVAGTAMAIASADFDMESAGDFLAWDKADDQAKEDDAGQNCSDNIFRYPAASPSVAIRVCSIHAVKGETHTATLVLDTFFKSHHLRMLKRWLTGAKAGGASENATMQSRLRLHYVAMSRPSHLLCLAMREDALTGADITRIIERGWRVGRVSDTGTGWINPGED
jgi:superfamily I DNA/RNA helicase